MSLIMKFLFFLLLQRRVKCHLWALSLLQHTCISFSFRLLLRLHYCRGPLERTRERKEKRWKLFVEAIISSLTFYISYSWYICPFITSPARSMSTIDNDQVPSMHAYEDSFQFFSFVRSFVRVCMRMSMMHIKVIVMREFIFVNHQDWIVVSIYL